MTDFVLRKDPFDVIHESMLEVFPELEPAHSRFIADWGAGEPPGQYIHIDLLDQLVELALLHQPTSSRDRLLASAFTFVDRLVQSTDPKIRDLGFVGVLESRAGWWYARARPFLGEASVSQLDQFIPEWRHFAEESKGVVSTIDEQSVRTADPWNVAEALATILGEPAA